MPESAWQSSLDHRQPANAASRASCISCAVGILPIADAVERMVATGQFNAGAIRQAYRGLPGRSSHPQNTILARARIFEYAPAVGDIKYGRYSGGTEIR